MHIGIDFNTKTMKGTAITKGMAAGKIFELKNILSFANDEMFVGDEAHNKFLTEREPSIYTLDQIVEINGLIINKKQISVQKCLSILFAHLLEKINGHINISEIDYICISIPYDKFYFWHDVIKQGFLLLGIEKLRVISQPAAFFAQPDIKYFHSKLQGKQRDRKQKQRERHNQALNEFEKNPWYKKAFSEKPSMPNDTEGNLFVSISEDNTNVSLVEYSEDVLEVVSTQYTNTITNKKIETAILDYFLSEISKDPEKFSTKDKKNLLRILEVVDEFLRSPLDHNTFEVNLPYLLSEDGGYKLLNIQIDRRDLNNFLSPIFKELVQTIKELAQKTQDAQKDMKHQKSIGDIIFIADLFIQNSIKSLLENEFENREVYFGDNKTLVTGASNYGRVLTGENRSFLALEALPFSVLIKMGSGESIELFRKDITLPTFSKGHCFSVSGKGKSKSVEIHMMTKEGDAFQSLNVWKIETGNWKKFNVEVWMSQNMEIQLTAYPLYESMAYEPNTKVGDPKTGEAWKLNVQRGSTFSFNGAGFEVGIKGKNLRQYILNQFNYLYTIFPHTEQNIFEPNEQFYSYLKNGDGKSALSLLGKVLNLKTVPDIELTDSAIFEERGVAGFISGRKISIPTSFKKDPYGFGYVLAHELAHHVLINDEDIILDNEQENEILTEIFVIYSGMGKLFLNGFETSGASQFAKSARGYLDRQIIKYIHEIYFEKFNVNKSDYEKLLTRDGKNMLE